MTGTLTLFYGAASYTIFFFTFLYAIGFVGNAVVPTSLDAPATEPWQTALAIDLGLLSLFAVQHSVMARQGFKRLITRIIPQSIERSTYVLASSLTLALLFWQWRPLGGVVWEVEHPVARTLLDAGFVFGWSLVLITTFAINHFDLFGLRQTWRAFRGQPQPPATFVTPVLYRMVRHPLYLGWMFAFWSTPSMTVSHLCFAIVATTYILGAIQLEERDLIRELPEYAAYRQRVPMIVPTWPRALAAPDATRGGRTLAGDIR